MRNLERVLKRGIRNERHYRIWAVLRFMLVAKSLDEEMHSFYDYQNRMTEYKLVISRLNTGDAPTKQDIDSAIRLCQMKYKQGKCSYEIKPYDIITVYNWPYFQINHKDILENIIVRFKEYWDNILSEYKRIHAKRNRLKYLIDLLSEIKETNYILCNNLSGRISDLITHYEEIMQNSDL